MSWFLRSSSLDDLQRQTAISLLFSLEARLQICLEPYRAVLQTGQIP